MTDLEGGNDLGRLTGSNGPIHFRCLTGEFPIEPLVSPPPRSGHSIVEYDGKIVLFGGSIGKEKVLLWNDMYVFDPATLCWAEVIGVSGVLPVPRHGHAAASIAVRVRATAHSSLHGVAPFPTSLSSVAAAVAQGAAGSDSASDRLAYASASDSAASIAGGGGPGSGGEGPEAESPHVSPLRDLLLTDGSSIGATALTSTAPAASSDDVELLECESVPFRLLGTVTGDHLMLVVGGTTGAGPVMDVHSFNFRRLRWDVVEVPGPVPTGRSGHTLTAIGRGRFLVFGGRDRDGEVLNDVWVLNSLGGSGWTKPAIGGRSPAGRSGHAAVLHRNQLLVYGGQSRATSFSDLWVLDLDRMRWSEINLREPVRSMSTVVLLGSRLLVCDMQQLRYARHMDLTGHRIPNDWTVNEIVGDGFAAHLAYSILALPDESLFAVDLTGRPLVYLARYELSGLTEHLRIRDVSDLVLSSARANSVCSLLSGLGLDHFPFACSNDGADSAAPLGSFGQLNSSSGVSSSDLSFHRQRSSVVVINLHSASRAIRAIKVPEGSSLAIVRKASTSAFRLSAGTGLVVWTGRVYLTVSDDDQWKRVLSFYMKRMVKSGDSYVFPINIYLAAAASDALGGGDRVQRLAFLSRQATFLSDTGGPMIAGGGVMGNPLPIASPLAEVGAGHTVGPAEKLELVDTVTSINEEGEFLHKVRRAPDGAGGRLNYGAFGGSPIGGSSYLPDEEDEHDALLVDADATAYAEPSALPKFHNEPDRRTLIRSLHRKLKSIESKGVVAAFGSRFTSPKSGRMRREDQDELFIWPRFFMWLVIMALFPLCALLMVLTLRLNLKGVVCSILVSGLYVGAVALPVFSMVYASYTSGSVLSESDLPVSEAWVPIVLLVIFSLILAHVEATWRDTKLERNDLNSYRVKIIQKLINDEYGERLASGTDVVYAITQREELQRDAWWIWPLVVLASAVVTCLHCMVPLIAALVRSSLDWSQDVVIHIITFSTIGMNFVLVFLFFAMMGVVISIYQRHLNFVYYFSMITQSRYAPELDLPVLPLNTTENVMAWAKIMGYIQHHDFLPLETADAVLGWALVLNIILWIAVTMELFSGHTDVSSIYIILIFDAVAMTGYVGLSLVVNSRITRWRVRHIRMLLKEQLKMTLELQRVNLQMLSFEPSSRLYRSHRERAIDIDSTISVMRVLISVLQSQTSTVKVLGLSFGENTTRVVFGITFPLAVAVITRTVSNGIFH